MKTLIIISDSPYSVDKTITTVKCLEYKIHRPFPTASFEQLDVTRLNGNIDSWMHMTEVHEVVWKKGEA